MIETFNLRDQLSQAGRDRRSPEFFQSFFPNSYNNLIDCTISGTCNGNGFSSHAIQQIQPYHGVPFLLVQQVPQQVPSKPVSQGPASKPVAFGSHQVVPASTTIVSGGLTLQQASQPLTVSGACTCPSTLYPGTFIQGTLTCFYPTGLIGGRKCRCTCSL